MPFSLRARGFVGSEDKETLEGKREGARSHNIICMYPRTPRTLGRPKGPRLDKLQAPSAILLPQLYPKRTTAYSRLGKIIFIRTFFGLVIPERRVATKLARPRSNKTIFRTTHHSIPTSGLPQRKSRYGTSERMIARHSTTLNSQRYSCSIKSLVALFSFN